MNTMSRIYLSIMILCSLAVIWDIVNKSSITTSMILLTIFMIMFIVDAVLKEVRE